MLEQDALPHLPCPTTAGELYRRPRKAVSYARPVTSRLLADGVG